MTRRKCTHCQTPLVYTNLDICQACHDEVTGKVHLPTAEQIAAECAELRQKWSNAETRKRAGLRDSEPLGTATSGFSKRWNGAAMT